MPVMSVLSNGTCVDVECEDWTYNQNERKCDDDRPKQLTAFLLSLFLSSTGAANFYIGSNDLGKSISCSPRTVYHNCANVSCVALRTMQQLICCHFYGLPAPNHSLILISDVINVPHMICWHTLAFDLLLYQATSLDNDVISLEWHDSLVRK